MDIKLCKDEDTKALQIIIHTSEELYDQRICNVRYVAISRRCVITFVYRVGLNITNKRKNERQNKLEEMRKCTTLVRSNE